MERQAEEASSATSHWEQRGGGSIDIVEPRKRPFYRRPRLFIPLVIVVLVLLALGVVYYLHTRGYESTDDAFIANTPAPITPRVEGTVLHVRVSDNEDVAAGQVILELDPKDFELALRSAQGALSVAQSRAEVADTNVELVRATTSATLTEAKASVEQARAGVESARQQLASAQADVTAAQAESDRRQADLKRYESTNRGAVSEQVLDAARAAAEAAAAQLNAARKRAAAAEAQITEAQAKVLQAQGALEAANTAAQQVAVAEAQARAAQAEVSRARSAVERAQLNLSYTKVAAPIAGRITQKNVQVGQFLRPGQPVMSIVPREVWVTANFKETQLTQMRAGQDVEIEVDAYPGRTFHGKVHSIQAGTGAAFSLLPPENATGNYVKVVQRVPVKIVFTDDPQARQLLAPGMSVVPRVNLRSAGEGGPLPISHPQATADAARER